MASASEPFPLLNTGADRQVHTSDVNAARRRRKSSGLGDLRLGDTGAPGLASGLAHLNGSVPQANSDSKDGGAKRFSKRRKARSAFRRAKHYSLKHTWVIPLVILALFGVAYAVNPTKSNPVHRFIFLSYELPLTKDAGGNVQYGKGLWDLAFVSFYTVVLSFTREFIMQEILRPMARYCGLRSRAKQARYMEQMYTAIYFGIMGPVGLYVMSRSPVWYFNTHGMYENFPHKTHEAVFKFYYLFEAAYWAQQAIVLLLGMEARRKDFKELVGHHIVTLALIACSYRFHFTYMGVAVYITHDISDFFLATSKSLNYVNHPLVGPFYATFVLVWIYTRHYLNLRIIYSLFNEFQTVGPYELNWETQQYKSPLAFYITFALLASLQALNLFWLWFIFRSAYRFAVLKIAKDDRSDGEESEVEDNNNNNHDGKAAAQLENEHNSAIVNGVSFADAAAAAANGKVVKPTAVGSSKATKKSSSSSSR
ncbi:TLC domain-containing protein [Podospora didyma]|uniref:TLC domain-containing protein n=1 Tax=Podospora didyma TaxID=330526 RepID=A0AAE0KEE1_9PEZI|nr:TLC domain-containing protein [Podospora didyma]